MKYQNRNTRGLRAGGYSIALSAVVIAAVVVLNLLVGKLPSSITKPETSSVKLYDFAEQTRAVAEGVDEDVTIYVWAEKASADPTIDEFLNRYAALNSRISVKYVDPALNPTFMEKYTEEEPSANSLIVESGKRFRLVDTGQIYTYSYDEQTLYYYYMSYGTMPSPDVFDAENAVTNAVDYVTTDVLPTVYALSGHGEIALGANLSKRIDAENIAVETLSLLTAETVPEDCDLLLIASPQQDITAEELEKILAYLENGGDVLLYTGYVNAASENLAKLCEAYGLRAETGIVFEQASNAYGTPYSLIAEIDSHAITEPLISAKSNVIVPIAHGIQTIDAYRSTLTVTPLLSTSDGAYLKNPETMESVEKEDGDKAGPFMLAAVASETVGDKTGNFIWVASDVFFEDSSALYGNTDFIMNLFGYTCEKESAVTVRSVNLAIEPLVISDSASKLWSVVATIVVPAAAVLAGFGIWWKRRKR